MGRHIALTQCTAYVVHMTKDNLTTINSSLSRMENKKLCAISRLADESMVFYL